MKKKRRIEKRNDKDSKNKEGLKKKVKIATKNWGLTFGRIKSWVKDFSFHII